MPPNSIVGPENTDGVEFLWIAQAKVDGQVFCQGTGKSKAAAKCAAAEQGLSKLRENIEG